MYVTSFKIIRPAFQSDLLDQLFNAIAEIRQLPDAQTIRTGLTRPVSWPGGDYRIFYLDQIQPEPRDDTTLVEIRFPPSSEAREDVIVELSYGADNHIERMCMLFPGKPARGLFTRTLESLKSITHQLQINGNDLDVEIEGFREDNGAFIREHSISAFYFNEQMKVYFHTREDMQFVPSYKRFLERHSR